MSWLFRTLLRCYGATEPLPRDRRVSFTASTFAAERERMLRNIASPIPFQNYLNEMRLLALDDLGKNHMTLDESAKIRKSANRMWKKLTPKMRSKYRTLAANAHKTTLTLDRLLDGNVYQPCRQMLIPINDDIEMKELRETILAGAPVACTRDVSQEVSGSSKTKGKQSGRQASFKSVKGRKGPSQGPPLRKSKRVQAKKSQSQPQSQQRPQKEERRQPVPYDQQEHQQMDLGSQSLFRAQQLARSQVQSRSQSRPQARSQSHSQSHSPSRTQHSHPYPRIPASSSRKRSLSTSGCSSRSSSFKDEEIFLQPEYLMEYIINSNKMEDSLSGHRAAKRMKHNYIQN